MVNITNHGQPDFTLMMWGSIWLGGRSDILLMERDGNSKGGGYTTWSYLRVLEEGLLPYYKPRTFFYQDNAKIYVLKVAQRWFKEHRI